MKMGKSGKTALIYVVVLSILLGTAAFILLQASAASVTARVKFEPRKIDLAAPAPKEFQVTLSFSGQYDVSNVDAKTILVGGILEPKGGWKHVKIVKDNLVFQVDGPGLVDWVILPQIYHMVPDPNPNKPYKFPITVTGEFYDETTFEGTFDISVMIPTTPPGGEPNPPQG